MLSGSHLSGLSFPTHYPQPLPLKQEVALNVSWNTNRHVWTHIPQLKYNQILEKYFILGKTIKSH